jgi:uncharacterized membrane protein
MRALLNTLLTLVVLAGTLGLFLSVFLLWVLAPITVLLLYVLVDILVLRRRRPGSAVRRALLEVEAHARAHDIRRVRVAPREP